MPGGVGIGVGIAAGAVALGAAWPAFWWLSVRTLEKPSYVTLRKLGEKAEVRRYAPYVIAEATLPDSDLRGAMNQGFQRVAGYIFGGNTAQSGGSEKIAMTSPVRTEALGGEGGGHRVSFVLPSKYSLKSLPVPADARVKLREVGSHVAAALEFSGGVGDTAAYAQKTAELKQLLSTHGLVASGEPAVLADYYPPFAPGWLRKREVIIPLKDEGKA